MQQVIYADCDTPQSFESPPPAFLQKKEEDRFISANRPKRKARPIENTRIWVLNCGTNTQVKKEIEVEQVA